MQEGPIVKKTLASSVEIITYCQDLIRKKEYDIGRQLKRSGTSIGANVFEAQYAESKLDFIHKMKLAPKEASETLYRLTFCGQIPDSDVPQKMVSDIKEILAILSTIIIISKKSLK